MSITQSTLKTKHIDADGYQTTYYGFTSYDGSTDTVAIVRNEDSVSVYQLDPERLEDAIDQLHRYLTWSLGINPEWVDVAIHVQPPAIKV